MANIGDYVRFLNDVGGGRITRINGQTAYVTDEDGFETPVLLRECVVVPADRPSGDASSTSSTSHTSAERVIEETPAQPVAETAEGEKLTAVLMFEPHDIKRLSTTDFDCLLVNDSNYHMLYSVATREALDTEWTLLGAGTVEPGTQILLEEVAHDDLPSLERLSVQLIAYKPGKPFSMKPVVAVETKLDNTRFAKLHCFSRSDYSTVPVLTVPLIEADRVNRPVNLAEVVRDAAPKAADSVAPKHAAGRQARQQTADGPQVVDLHIAELVDNLNGLTPTDMLARQVDEFHRHMRALKGKPGSKIVFIHGKGEGVLRHTILDQLRRYYPKCEAQDASFREYGFGATQITIH
ncbi:MAG: DUF2027 domain-containing protein [Muribaculaceae bacterium]|nr:DUF2027 domain-containing protein [Muribaculaceae bacterium]